MSVERTWAIWVCEDGHQEVADAFLSANWQRCGRCRKPLTRTRVGSYNQDDDPWHSTTRALEGNT